MLSQLLFELRHVPTWVLVMLVNFAAAVFCAVFILHDLDSKSALRTTLVALAWVVISAIVGVILVIGFCAIHVAESWAWRVKRKTSAAPAPRVH